MRGTSTRVIAHRGGGNLGPENSASAAAAAIAAGADGVEVDLRMTADAQLVLAHDPFHHGLEIEATALRALRERGPLETLDALVDAVGGCFIDLEIKAPLSDPVAMTRLIEDAIRDVDPSDVLITSFFLPAVAEAARLGTAIGVLTSAAYDEDGTAAIRSASAVGAGFALPSEVSITPSTAAEAAEHSIELIAWTVNDPSRAQVLTGWGVAGLITDDPATIAGSKDPR